MLSRTLEPEVMDDQSEVEAYDEMDHREVNTQFVSDLLDQTALDPGTRVLDIGSGTGLILIELASRVPDILVTGVDLSSGMIDRAREHVAANGFEDRVELRVEDATRLPFEDASFSQVISNSILHHLPDPRACLVEAVRVLDVGGLLFFRDLLRPDSADEVERLVQLHAEGANPQQQQLLRQSLHASLTVEELQGMLEGIENLDARVTQTSDRHWTLVGHKR